MSEDNDQTKSPAPEFDFSLYPQDSVFHERRDHPDRRHDDTKPAEDFKPDRSVGHRERRQKKERRRRIDPTTFEKQYTDDELEFMNAMQRYKELSGKMFPTYGDVIRVAVSLGYRRAVFELDPINALDGDEEPVLIIASTRDN